MDDLLKSGEFLDDKWFVEDVLGRGTYGQVYRATDTNAQKKVAIKVENRLRKRQYLHIEEEILSLSADCEHICRLIGSGAHIDYCYIVMDLVGDSLGSIFEKGDVTAEKSLNYVNQMLDAIQYLHERDYLHRDVKPNNFALDLGNKTVMMLDFGLSRKYRDANGLIAPRPIASFQGTITYASMNAHNRKEMGRHDDLWSLLYILVHFITGELPWSHATEKAQAAKIKQETCHKQLCSDSRLPKNTVKILNHLNDLLYEIEPNYNLLRKVLQYS